MNLKNKFPLFLSILLLTLGWVSTNVFAVNGTLVWHTYQGGSVQTNGANHDRAMGIAKDAAGNLYVVGHSVAAWDTPVDALNPVNPHHPVVSHAHQETNQDVFVAKFNSDGALIWHTFMGAQVDWWGSEYRGWTGMDEGMGIAVDSIRGAVYVTGMTTNIWTSPSYALKERYAFLARLDTTTGIRTWHQFMGAYNIDKGSAVAVDADGHVYVAGQSWSPWGSPIRNNFGGYGGDAFVAKFTSAGTMTWNTFLGGSNMDVGYDIELDTAGNIFVAGASAFGDTYWCSIPGVAWCDTTSDQLKDTMQGGGDAFVAKLTNDGDLVWYGFHGGAPVGGYDYDDGYGVTTDDMGHVFLTGVSWTPWTAPVTVDPHAGFTDQAFIAKIDSVTGTLLRNTFMAESGHDIVVNGDGHVFVTGISATGYLTGEDAFACELDNDLNQKWCSNLFTDAPPDSYTGCGGSELGHGIAVGSDGHVYLAGRSQYGCDAPVPVNYHVDYGGPSTGDDMLLAKIKPWGGEIWGISLNGHTGGNPGPSSLYQIDRATGAGTLVGTDLGYAVNSIAIDPTTGVMYAATTAWDGSFHGLLYVDTATGAAAEIGEFTEEPGGWFHTIVGLTFDSTGQLWGWAEWSGPFGGDDLVQIDKTTGAVTTIGESGLGDFSHSHVLAFDSSDTLFLVQGPEVYETHLGTGALSSIKMLDFDPGSGGAAFDPATGLLWAAEGHQSGKIYDSVIRVSNIWANTHTDIDTDIEFLHAITISDAPYIEQVTNTAPVANDEDYLALINTPLVVPAPGVLGNDYDLDGNAIEVKQLTLPLHGDIVMMPNGSFTYTPDPDYCGLDSLTYIVIDDPPPDLSALDSAPATVSFTVACGDNPPVAMDDFLSTAEDTELVMLAPGVLGNDYDLDGDPIAVTWHSDTSHGALSVAADGSVTYIPSDDYCGPDSFTYVVTDGPLLHPPQESEPAMVHIWVDCVNDPPIVTSVTPGTGIVDYSDYITQVTVTIEDIDSVGPDYLALRLSPGWYVERPPHNLPTPNMNSTEQCVTVPNVSVMDGSICTYTLDGQIVVPGDQTFTIGFKGADQEGHGPECTLSEYYPDVSVCQHVLTVEPEDATAMLDSGNPVAVEVAEAGPNSGTFSLFFSARETSNPDFAHGRKADFGDLNQMVPFMQLIPVGPGGPVDGDCGWDNDLTGGLGFPKPEIGQEYGQVAYFQCDFKDVPVNTYEVLARVDGVDETHRYYTGTDEDVFTVYDPSLGHITGGGWFYWPETGIPADACLEYECAEFDTPECPVFNYDVCLVPDPYAGYTGDKTNFGFTMKYNKKQKNLQGSLLLMRHTITDETWKVKSNALGDMSVGDEEDDAGAYGWAAVEGKATFREPGFDNTGGNPFLMYVEDHGEQGCIQDPVDEFWIEITDSEGIQQLQLNGPDPADNDPDNDPPLDGDDEPIECGNISVPHETGGKGKPDK